MNHDYFHKFLTLFHKVSTTFDEVDITIYQPLRINIQ